MTFATTKGYTALILLGSISVELASIASALVAVEAVSVRLALQGWLQCRRGGRRGWHVRRRRHRVTSAISSRVVVVVVDVVLVLARAVVIAAALVSVGRDR